MTVTQPRPALGAPPAWHAPAPDVSTLPNGLTVWTYHLPGQYVVSADLVLDIPLTLEPHDLEGVATICLRTLDEGSGAHPGETYAELLESAGAIFGGAATLSATEASLEVPVTSFDKALPIFAEGVLTPAHAETDVDRHITHRLAELAQMAATSASLAGVLTRRTLIADSRAARMNGGSSETVARISAQDVRDFHARHYSPAGATLILAGDFRGADPMPAVESAFGDWAASGEPPTHRGADPAPRTDLLVHRPGAVQADLRLGWFGVDRSDPRWPHLQVACYAMGGAFGSRLNKVLREERGYTYGISMAATPLRRGGMVTVQGSFRTDVVGRALAEAREILNITGRPFTHAEITDAVAYLTGTAPLRYSTAQGLAGQASTLAGAGLGPGAIGEALAALRTVTPSSATEAYVGALASAPSLIVVGDGDVLGQELGLAPEPVPAL